MEEIIVLSSNCGPCLRTIKGRSTGRGRGGITFPRYGRGVGPRPSLMFQASMFFTCYFLQERSAPSHMTRHEPQGNFLLVDYFNHEAIYNIPPPRPKFQDPRLLSVSDFFLRFHPNCRFFIAVFSLLPVQWPLQTNRISASASAPKMVIFIISASFGFGRK